jgi:hypothetical protein
MKYIFIVITLVLAASCSNNKSEDNKEENIPAGNELKLWRSDLNDSTGKLIMMQDNLIVVDSLTPTDIIGFINEQFPRVQLAFERISNDTIFIRIPDAMFLTQQMGSSGPTMFFSAAVYNLTELPGIRWVSFDFEEGDHASPGVLRREDFKNEL